MSYLELSDKYICDATYDSYAIKYVPRVTKVILQEMGW